MDTIKPQHRDQLEQEAVSWHVRLTSGAVKADEHAQFEKWRARSPAHDQAYLKIIKLWEQLEAPLRANREQHEQLPVETGHQPITKLEKSSWFITWGKSWAIAATIMIVVAIGLYPDYFLNPLADYRTHIGEHTTVNLADGSVVYLNTDSAINATISDRERSVTLLRGEAEFEVAHDSQRPFIVISGMIKTQAIGTKFLVRYNGKQGLVTLLEGKVRSSIAGINSQSKNEIMLKPGEQIAFEKNRINPITHPEITNMDTWKKGRLLMNFVTLEQAVTEINRYRRGTVKLLDSKLAKREINAVIDINQINAWLDALQDTLPLQVHRVGPLALITAK